MATFEQFYPWISLECPNVPPTLIDDAVRRAVRSFCEDTFAYEAEMAVSVTPAAVAYEPTLPTDTELLTVLSARIGTSSVDAVFPADLRRFEANTDYAPQQPLHYAVMDTNPMTVRVFPTPDTTYTVNLVLALRPTVTATAVDDVFASWYRDAIVHCALSLLMSQVGQSWSNPEGAVAHHMEYSRLATTARIMRYQGRAQVESAVTMRPFA